jgi:1-deoxy-D-xylulose-5-phosphate reductoisomerase
VEVLTGVGALEELAADPEVDLVVNALVGAAGLRPALAAARVGTDLALANKESLVMAGELLTSLAAEKGARIIPIDSEHSAIFRCLRGTEPEEVAGIVLTASGGPLRDLPIGEMADAGITDVLNHPTWTMGEKITIDSATLFNKGMEVIEAHWLFGLPYDRIGIVIHRESIVHSLVRLSDGSALAHLGTPDMRIPIQAALCYPDPPPRAFGECRLEDIGTLSFEPVDAGRYPCFALIMRAARDGGTAPAVAATADEVAIEAFLAGRIGFGDIAGVIEETMAAVGRAPADDLESILAADDSARVASALTVERLSRARGCDCGGSPA